MMCPLTCRIVKAAIKAHEERGVCMGEYIDMHKDVNPYCQLCTRNEKSKMPEHLKGDNGLWESDK